MARVECDGRPVPVEESETLLDAVLRAGIPLPHSCRAGVCQSCLVKATSGTPPAGSQVGLRPSLAQQGFLLACVTRPTEDLGISTDAAAGLTVGATITAVDVLAGDVVKVLVTPDSDFSFRAGQYVTLIREDGLARSYSIANLPGSKTLELHVRVLPGGQMSQWFASRPVGARVALRGPNGECFYEPAPEAPLVLAGTGTGLAPLWGVLHDALQAGHAGPIHVLHGARGPAGLYLVDELHALAAAHGNVAYSACVLDDARAGMTQGALDEVLFARFPNLSGHKVFLCGDPGLVQKMKRKAFLAGAKLADIRADAFITAPPPASATPN
ncbi:MAG: 2Fe-2S iron-sulfur cluster-binding protein [Vicinamibacterales bacterium]